MLNRLTTVPEHDFESLYCQPEQITKTNRRTREWTIPRLVDAGLSSGRVLSIGCGSGADVLYLRNRGYEAWGIDLYAGLPEAARCAVRASAAAIPFEIGYFDAVLCLEVLEHIEHHKRAKAALEMRRVVRRGGTLILATPKRFFPFDEHADFLRFHSPFKDDTLSVAEIEYLFKTTARPLTWKGYFEFTRFGLIASLLNFATSLLKINMLHRSPFNPHLFLEMRF